MASRLSNRTDRLTSECSLGCEPESEGHVALNLQFMSNAATRACIAGGRIVIAFSMGLLVLETVAKFTLRKNHFQTSDSIVVANVVAASLCLAALLGSGAAYAWRISEAVSAHKEWFPYQKRIMMFVWAQLFFQTMNASFYLAPNAHLLAVPCSWHLLMNDIFLFIRWTCWAALFFSMVVQASSMLPARILLGWFERFRLKWVLGKHWPESADELMVYDLSSWVHAPLLVLLWVPAQTCVLLLTLWLLGVLEGNKLCTSIDDPHCAPPDADPNVPCNQWKWTCETKGTAYYVLTSLTGAVLLAMLGTYFFLMHIVRKELAKLPYTKYRVANQLARFQMQVQTVVCIVLTICIVVTWWVKNDDSCNSYVFAWFGMPPMQLLLSCIVVLNAIYTIPVSPTPQQLWRYQSLHSVLWREGDMLTRSGTARVPSKVGQVSSKGWWSMPVDAAVAAAHVAREAVTPLAGGHAGETGGAEMAHTYCFETALKSLYWSSFMYNYAEEDDIEDSTYSLEVAMGLFDLKHHRLLWDPKKTDTKCMVAWGDDTILVAFRGTASLANVLADLKAWRTVHPPKRGVYWFGTQPMVHKGFLDAYTAEGHNVKIMELLRAILAGKAGPGDSNEPSRRWGSGKGLSSSKQASSNSVGSDSPANGSGVAAAAADDGADGAAGSGTVNAAGSSPFAAAGSSSDSNRGSSGGSIDGDGVAEGASLPQREWRVICIGHSLGGALATLTAYDIAKEAEHLRRKGWSMQVKLYTFGAPRPGNHAFAREFIQAVPDSWDTIHSNDAVAKQGKMLIAYKRAANRVVITGTGDLLPRPSILEANLHRGTGASIKLHFLLTYARSFAAVIRGQFQSKAMDAASRDALRQLVACRFVRDMMLGFLSFRAKSLWRMRFSSGGNARTMLAPHPDGTSFTSMPGRDGGQEGGEAEVSSASPAALLKAQREQWVEEVLAEHPELEGDGDEEEEEEELGGQGLGPAQEQEKDFNVATGQRLPKSMSQAGRAAAGGG